MAHYKRGKCRYVGKNRSDTTSFYRKRHGLKPYNLKTFWASAPRWGTPGYVAYRQEVRRLWPRQFNMMCNHPRAWDIVHHTRPRRAAERRLTRDILTGRRDPDDTAWPLSKKPHQYYW